MISVLLPYRDAAATIANAARSVLEDLGPNDELIAIDDGSSDGSAAIVEGLAARDPRIAAIASGGTTAHAAGIVVALRRGFDVARGEHIGRMDADDISLPGRFAAQKELLESDEALGAVGVLVEGFPAPSPGMQRYLAWQSSLITREDHARAIFVEAPLCHPSTLMRRAAVASVGGFREGPWPEDYDLWLRLDAAGHGLAKVPRVLFRWRLHAGSMTWTDPRFSRARFLEARAHHLALRLRKRGVPFAIWGAGKTGRKLARALERHEARPVAFVDIDPRKVGRAARGAPVVDAADGLARAKRSEIVLVVAVGEPGARDVVRARATAAGLAEGAAFICAA